MITTNQPLANQSNQEETLGQIATEEWNKNGTVTILATVAVLGLGAYLIYKLMKW